MAKGLKIVTVPSPILRKKSQSVELTPPVKKLVKRMRHTLFTGQDLTGLGLSAPQVGYNWRIFLTINKNQENFLPLRIFINPQIVEKSKEIITGVPNSEFPYEGCLSIPDIYGLVDRHEWIKVRYLTLEENKLVSKEEKFNDLLSVVIQHEYDHLEGILFVDRTITQGHQLFKLARRQGKEVLIPLEEKLNILQLKKSKVS